MPIEIIGTRESQGQSGGGRCLFLGLGIYLKRGKGSEDEITEVMNIGLRKCLLVDESRVSTNCTWVPHVLAQTMSRKLLPGPVKLV